MSTYKTVHCVRSQPQVGVASKLVPSLCLLDGPLSVLYAQNMGSLDPVPGRT